MIAAITILSVIAYFSIGSFLGTRLALDAGKSSVWSCDSPAQLTAGVFWPFVLPCLLGSKLARRKQPAALPEARTVTR